MVERVHFNVTGMTCGGCENAVKRAVGKIAGVTEVSASHTGKSVDVTYDNAGVTPDMIRQRIEALGYQVQP